MLARVGCWELLKEVGACCRGKHHAVVLDAGGFGGDATYCGDLERRVGGGMSAAAWLLFDLIGMT
jgi:hypothetical protein